MLTEAQVQEYKKLAKRQYASEVITNPNSITSAACTFECLAIDLVLGNNPERLDYLRKSFGNLTDEQEKLLFDKAKSVK